MTSYAVVTPVRDEADNLGRLAESLAAQTTLPDAWVVVDTGTTDGSQRVVDGLARAHPWVTAIDLDGDPQLARGGPIARAFEAGLAELGDLPDVVVKLDADLSFEPDYFERLLAEFDADARLGLASGTCFELTEGRWLERRVTAGTVWGASRAYRGACLRELLPLHRGMGWDGIDEARAAARGWTTRTFRDVPFRHHRREGERDGSQRAARAAQGRAAFYMGYRFSYLALRAVHHARRDPAAFAMIGGYLGAALRRQPRCDDETVVRYMRERQRLRALPRRAREVA